MSNIRANNIKTQANQRKCVLVLIAGIFAILLCVLLSLTFGSRNIDFNVVMGAISNQAPLSFEETVVRERIPRTVFGLIAGAALGMSGALMQAITRNPLADPSILGVNTGASLFVVCGIAFFSINTFMQYIWVALLGATISAVFVYAIASIGRGGATPIKLALAGAAFSAALSSLVSAVMLPRESVMNAFRFWQVGSISGTSWEAMIAVAPFIIGGVLLGIALSPALNILALGDDVATGLGINTGVVRILGALAGVLLCGAITALAGPIGFVGLMTPHAVRMLIGSDQRWIMPLSALYGSFLMLAADIIGRVMGRPGELEAGIVTAFLGAPVLIMIATRAKVRDL